MNIIYFLINYLDLILAFMGAIVGFVLIILIPIPVNIIYYSLKHPSSLKYANELPESSEDKEVSQTSESQLIEKSRIINPPPLSVKPYNEFKNYAFYVGQVLLICFGIFVLIVQFYPINFFGIVIKP
jgi:hypothetical protein